MALVLNHDYEKGGTFRVEENYTPFLNKCVICQNELTTIIDEYGILEEYGEYFQWLVSICLNCGWWWYGGVPNHSYSVGTWACGVLFQTENVSPLLEAGLAEIKKNSEKLYKMPATQFETFVGGVLSEFFDCKVIHTGKSYDGGIDLILIDSNDGKIPVQVKRRQKSGKIENVRLIREFRGAFLYRNFKNGIIVTTADRFTKAATNEAKSIESDSNYQGINLIDCHTILDILNVISNPKDLVWKLEGRLNFGYVQPFFNVKEKVDEFMSKL